MISDRVMNGALAVNLKRLRAQRAWSIRALAAQIGVAPSYAHALEQGTHANPSLIVVVRIARAFGVTLDALISAPHPPTERRRVAISILSAGGSDEA